MVVLCIVYQKHFSVVSYGSEMGLLTLREDYWQSGVLRKIFGLKREEVTG
jgi:hypothetical protein